MHRAVVFGVRRKHNYFVQAFENSSHERICFDRKVQEKEKLAEGSGNFSNSGQQITLGQVIKRSKPYSCGSQDRKRSLISHTIPSKSQDFVD